MFHFNLMWMWRHPRFVAVVLVVVLLLQPSAHVEAATIRIGFSGETASPGPALSPPIPSTYHWWRPGVHLQAVPLKQ